MTPLTSSLDAPAAVRPPTARDLWRAAERVRYLEGVIAEAHDALDRERQVSARLVELAAQADWPPERIARAQTIRRMWRWPRRGV